MSTKNTSSVLALTQDMMLVVIEQRWDVFMDMQIRQDEMLRQLFAETDLGLSDAEQADLFEVQRLNQEILQAAESHKSDIATEIRAIKQGKSKASAYQAL